MGPAAEPKPGTVHLLTLPGGDTPVIEALNDAVVVADENNRILYANGALRRLLGWEPAGIVGQLVTTLVPDRLEAAHLAGFRRFLRTRRPHLIGHPTRVPAVGADGAERQVEMVLSTLERRGGGLLLVATLRDVADRVDLARQTALAHHLLALLGEQADDDQLTMRMLAAIGESLDMVATALWSPDPDTDELVCAGFWHRAGRDAPTLSAASEEARFASDVGLPGRVWSARRPTWIEDLAVDPDFPRRAAAGADGVRSALAFPISAGGRLQGVIELFAAVPGVPDPSLVATMQVVGSRLGEFVQRVHLERERRRVAERERAVATALQRSLLPPSLPDIPGVELGVAFHPGGELVVGGDFYDVFVVPGSVVAGLVVPELVAPAAASGTAGAGRTPGFGGGRSAGPLWGVAIGDVCGTGPVAAAVTAQVRHTARALARRGAGPAEILGQINDALLDTDDRRFCTSIFALLAPSPTGVRLRLANAGHPWPVVRRRDGRVEQLAIGGPLLGVFERFGVEEHTVELAAGEALVLYTDGVTEARAGREQFGDARLIDEVRARPHASAAEVAIALERAARRFAGGAVSDDIAILVVSCPVR